MVEAMPQTPEVEEFLRAIVPFSDTASGEEGHADIDGEEDDQSEGSKDAESDSEEEFHDSMTETQHPLPVDVSTIVYGFVSMYS